MTGSDGNHSMSNGTTHTNEWRDVQLPSDHMDCEAHHTSVHTPDSGNTNVEEKGMVEERHRAINCLDITEMKDNVMISNMNNMGGGNTEPRDKRLHRRHTDEDR